MQPQHALFAAESRYLSVREGCSRPFLAWCVGHRRLISDTPWWGS